MAFSAKQPALRLPSLLPAVRGARRPDQPPPKRQRVSNACDACRTRKSKCNGARPTCSECVARGSKCQYSERESRVVQEKYEKLRCNKTAYERLFELLKSMPEQDSIDVLKRIRAGGDIGAILSQISEGSLLMQLSVVPETRRRYEFPYISHMPAFLLTPDNPYLKSMVYEATFSIPEFSPANTDMLTLQDLQAPYLKPYHAATLVDPLMLQVSASKWTSVISDDQLLRRLLSGYFLNQHPIFSVVHKDLFLEDMVSGRTRFCSSLLVNALLALACQSSYEIPDRSQFWLPSSLTYRFTAEAKRLWELEPPGQNRLTTIQASIAIHITMNLNGLDRIGTSYLVQAISMAHDIDLFKAPERAKEETMQKARIFTAWALFSWQVLVSYYFLRSPYIETPPETPLPDPIKESQWYGEVWIQYPLSETPTPIHLGCTMKAIADIRMITNDLALQTFNNGGFPGHLLRAHVFGFKSRLDAWLSDLPDPLTPRKIVFPAHFKPHMEYYSLILGIFQPQEASDPLMPNDVPISTDRISQEIISVAKNRLETLTRLYYLRHNFEAHDGMLLYYLLLLGNIAVEHLETIQASNSSTFVTPETVRSTLIMCAKGLEGQGRNFHVANLGLRALESSVKPDDMQVLRTYVAHEGEVDEKSIVQHRAVRRPGGFGICLDIRKLHI